MRRLLCRLLVITMALAPWQPVSAAMIDTDRAAIASALEREDVARALQSFGVDAESARMRAAALTDDEARELAARIESAPAAGGSVLPFLLWFGIALVIYLYVWRRDR